MPRFTIGQIVRRNPAIWNDESTKRFRVVQIVQQTERSGLYRCQPIDPTGNPVMVEDEWEEGVLREAHPVPYLSSELRAAS